MNNYKIFFALKTLKKILESFVDSFLVLYFFNVSDSNILPLGIYKLVSAITLWCIIFLTRNIVKSKHRSILLRIGIILDFIHFLAIILLRDKVVNYIYLIGLLYGLEEGFYFSVYNIIESDGITNDERTKFMGSYTAVNSILSIIFPLVFGSLIYSTEFLKSLIIVLIIVAFRIILSFIFKDKNIPESTKTNMKEYFKLTKNNNQFRNLYKTIFYYGTTYCGGAFNYIVTIYIIKVFSNSFSLGIFTSIFSIITCLLGILYARFIKKEHYPIIIKISTILTVVSLISMIFKCNAMTIVLFNLFQTILKELLTMINGTSRANLSNLDFIKKEYKTEYWLTTETVIVIARTVSDSLFILMAFVPAIYIMVVFISFLILLGYNSIKLQNVISKDDYSK